MRHRDPAPAGAGPTVVGVGRAGQTDQPDDQRGQKRTALTSIAAASLLVALKLGTGLITGSLALVSAGIESSGDVVAAVLTFFAIRLTAR